MISLIKFSLRHKNCVNFTDCRRFAGHSKWANIKHTKMAKDAQKSDTFKNFVNKMKVAITEGKSSNPEINLKLAKIIDEAKKKSMPMATIKNFLEKAQRSKIASHSIYFETKGPSGCLILIHLVTDNIPYTRGYINLHLKKSGFSPTEIPNPNLFREKGLVYTEVDGRNIDKVIDDAIEVGAEEAEKLIEDSKDFIQFTCSAMEVSKVRINLENLNYKIIETEVIYVPLKYVTLSDKEMEYVNKLYNRLNQMEEVVHLYNNISA